MFEIYDVVLIPLILGIVELLKKAGISKRFLPIFSLLIGIGIGVVYVADADWKQGVLVGAMLGLSASGLYSGSKKYSKKLATSKQYFYFGKEEKIMVKIAIDAGHGLNTPGKRTPDNEREWSFNNKVALACIAKLNTYQNVQTLRLDDPTGKTDVPLKTRTDRANSWKADALVSCHHNAYLGRWGNHGGVETITQTLSQKAAVDIAREIHPRVVRAMGLIDRGLKTMNLHVTRESHMPAVLVEGGFMDSRIDIMAMRSDAKLKAQGEAIAEGLAAYFKLVKKTEATGIIYKYGDSGPGVKKLQQDLNKTVLH